MVFIQPTSCATTSSGACETNAKYDYMREQQQAPESRDARCCRCSPMPTRRRAAAAADHPPRPAPAPPAARPDRHAAGAAPTDSATAHQRHRAVNAAVPAAPPRCGCPSPSPSARRAGARASRDGNADCVYRAAGVADRDRRGAPALRVPLQLTAVADEEFDALLRKTYEGGDESMQRWSRASKATPTSRTWRRNCPSRPTCSRATTTRRSSA